MTTPNDQTTTDIAKQALEQAGATGQPGAPAGDGTTGAGATPAPAVVKDNAFESEDAELARLEAEQAKATAAATAGAAGTAAAGQPAPVAAASGQPAAAAAAPGQPAAKDPAAQAKELGNKVEGAVIALRRKNAELAAHNLVLTGQVQALSSVADPARHAGPGTQEAGAGDTGGAAQLTIEQELEAIDAKTAELAVKLDKGDIDMQEYVKETTGLRRKERELVREQAAADVAASVQGQPNNDLGLQEHVQVLLSSFPILNKLSRAQLEPYEKLAYSIAAAKGSPIPEGPMGTKRLREEMAELAERDFDPTRYAARQTARATAAQAGGGTAAQGGQGQPGATGAAKPAAQQPTSAQRGAKLELAAGMPPDIGAIGAGATGGEITAEQGAAALSSFKNDDEAIRWLDANPQFVQKVVGGSFRVNPVKR